MHGIWFGWWLNLIQKGLSENSRAFDPLSGCQLLFTYTFFAFIFSLNVSANVYVISCQNLVIISFMIEKVRFEIWTQNLSPRPRRVSIYNEAVEDS